jgi:hypothetical protein
VPEINQFGFEIAAIGAITRTHLDERVAGQKSRPMAISIWSGAL